MFDLFPSSSILEELVDRGLNRWHSFEELNYKKKGGWETEVVSFARMD